MEIFRNSYFFLVSDYLITSVFLNISKIGAIMADRSYKKYTAGSAKTTYVYTHTHTYVYIGSHVRSVTFHRISWPTDLFVPLNTSRVRHDDSHETLYRHIV